MKHLRKYDIPVPRYTSYPTVPFWNTKDFAAEHWLQALKIEAESKAHAGLAIYIHLPFCESLCTYCGCNKYITTNHSVEQPYIQALKQEWNHYLKLLEFKPLIRSIHLGGGTPTFFAPESLRSLLEHIYSTATTATDFEGSVEVHPNYTRYEHLQTLADFTFRRISVGVQDTDERVQYIINRIQPVRETERVINEAKKTGFEQINIDLVYGLPLQTIDSIRHTLDHVVQLRPDRIAYYSYAHVPWKSKAQRRFTEEDLPTPETKWEMRRYIEQVLQKHGYLAIGMDHYALAHDPLFIARENGTLYRNFMGYTVQHAPVLIGLGASSISECGAGYAQNVRTHTEYVEKIATNHFAIEKGHLKSMEDTIIGHHILDLMCHYKTSIAPETNLTWWKESQKRLTTMIEDGLVECSSTHICIKESGRNFVRNAAACLDPYFNDTQTAYLNLFSKAV